MTKTTAKRKVNKVDSNETIYYVMWDDHDEFELDHNVSIDPKDVQEWRYHFEVRLPKRIPVSGGRHCGIIVVGE